VSDNKLQKNLPNAIKEKGQYALAFVVIASMLVVTNVPVFVIFFFGIFAFFVIKMFAVGSKNETREIFEFYLSANEILRDDDRRWYGFELKETIDRGEEIVRKMSAAPPLVKFTLGALYNKFGDHKAAVSYLGQIVENPSADESAYVFPTPELRSYVKILRKIEREPADAPLTSAAVRALERARKVRGKILLEQSRTAFATGEPIRLNGHAEGEMFSESRNGHPANSEHGPNPATIFAAFDHGNDDHNQKRSGKRSKEDEYANRQPISDVLHDIYDKNVS